VEVKVGGWVKVKLEVVGRKEGVRGDLERWRNRV
jgi:hypothetical protein